MSISFQAFEGQIHRMNEVFSRKLKDEQIGLLYKHLSHWTFDDIHRAVDLIIVSETYPPTLGKFTEYITLVKKGDKGRPTMLRTEAKAPTCPLCHDSGVVSAHKISEKNTAPYAFKCSCKAGQMTRSVFPSWPPKYPQDWRVWTGTGTASPSEEDKSILRDFLGRDVTSPIKNGSGIEAGIVVSELNS